MNYNWTPCNEGLPKKNGVYLVTECACNKFSVRTVMFDLDLHSVDEYDFPIDKGYKGKPGFYDEDSEWGYFDVTEYVVAWQPVPEPWKGDE